MRNKGRPLNNVFTGSAFGDYAVGCQLLYVQTGAKALALCGGFFLAKSTIMLRNSQSQFCIKLLTFCFINIK